MKYNAELFRGSRTFNGIARRIHEDEYARERLIARLRRVLKKTVFCPPMARRPKFGAFITISSPRAMGVITVR